MSESQRIGLLDFLRGIAILGILTVNMFSFGLPELGYFAPYAWGENSPLDAFAFSASILLFQQKMYPLLAFLFGIGIYLLSAKEERGGGHSTGVYLRRMGVLAVLGFLHAVILWHGDILVWYAFAGLFAFLLRNLSTKLLLILAIGFTWGMSILCCTPAIGAMAAFSEHSMPHLEEYVKHPATIEDAAEFVGQPYWENFGFFVKNFMQNPRVTALEAHYYANGTWLELVPLRLFVYMNTTFSAFIMAIPLLTGIMLFGILAGRMGVIVGGSVRGRACWIAILLGVLVGLPICAIGLWMVWIKNPAALYGSMTLNMIGGPLVAALYIVILSSIYNSPIGRVLAYPVECVGRMALTNYIGQTIVFVTLFQGWGFGWYGQLGYAGLSSLVLASWVAQGALSVLWLRFFRFGPLEWVWRCATYGRLQPLLRKADT